MLNNNYLGNKVSKFELGLLSDESIELGIIEEIKQPENNISKYVYVKTGVGLKVAVLYNDGTYESRKIYHPYEKGSRAYLTFELNRPMDKRTQDLLELIGWKEKGL